MEGAIARRAITTQIDVPDDARPHRWSDGAVWRDHAGPFSPFARGQVDPFIRYRHAGAVEVRRDDGSPGQRVCRIVDASLELRPVLRHGRRVLDTGSKRSPPARDEAQG